MPVDVDAAPTARSLRRHGSTRLAGKLFFNVDSESGNEERTGEPEAVAGPVDWLVSVVWTVCSNRGSWASRRVAAIGCQRSPSSYSVSAKQRCRNDQYHRDTAGDRTAGSFSAGGPQRGRWLRGRGRDRGKLAGQSRGACDARRRNDRPRSRRLMDGG